MTKNKTSGKTVYKSLSVQITSIETEHEALSANILSSQREISSLHDERELCFTQLATFYLPDLEAESVKSTIKELQGQVKKIYDEKMLRRQKLDEQIGASQDTRRRLDKQLHSLEHNLEEKAAERDSLQKNIAEELAENQEYIQWHAQAQQAQTRLDQNKKRYETFKADAQRKLQTYQREPLFTYLLQRKFSTSAYAGSGLTQKLDTFVASLVKYSQAKANYDFLCSMPDAIKAEVERQQAELDPLVGKIQRMENELADRRGLTAVIDDGKKIEAEKKQLITALNQENIDLQRYSQERKEIDNRKGAYHQAALGTLKDYLQGNSLSKLKQRARETPDKEDDGLVERIENIDKKIEDLKEKAKSAQDQQSTLAAKLDGLRTLSHTFNSKDYRNTRSYFDDGLDFDSFLMGYLSGQNTFDDLSTQIAEHQHWEPKPTHSSYDSSSYTPSHRHSSGSGWSGGGDIGGGSSDWSSGGDTGGGGWSSGGDV